MTIETKYNKDDTAWYMKDNKPTPVKISGIEVFYVGTDQDYIKYTAEDFHQPKTWLDHQNLRENELFPSKEALIASL